LVTDVGNSQLVTSTQSMPVAQSGGGVIAELKFSDKDYPNEKLAKNSKRALMPLLLELQNDERATLSFDVHDSSDGGRMKAQIRTARVAAAIKKYFEEKGISADRIKAAALGASRPVMPGSSVRAKKMNRRISLKVERPVLVPFVRDSELDPFIRVASKELKLDDNGLISGLLTVASDSDLVFDMLQADGTRLHSSVALFEGRVRSAVPELVPEGFRPEKQALIGSRPADVAFEHRVEDVKEKKVLPPLATATGEGPGEMLTSGEETVPTPDAELSVDAISGYSSALPQSAVKSSAPVMTFAREKVQPIEVGTKAGTQEEAALIENTVSFAEAKTMGVSDLYVYLPDEGAVLRGERLTIRGRADRKNAIAINGEKVVLDELNRFVRTLVLPAGPVQVEVTSTDKEGNVARVLRNYTVPRSEFFVMALADTVLGMSNKLEGMNDDTTLDFDNEIYAHGRVIAYVKGRIKGKDILEELPFEDIRVTAHVDTGKEEDADLVRHLIDPERYYPVYGDTSKEVQDVSSREKIYVMIEADKSKAVVGNFKTAIDGVELYRYQRTLFGASLDIDHEFIDEQRSQIKLFAANANAGVHHRQLAMQGTGGSMFFLKDRDLIEGSERVIMVVRDAITGSRMQDIPMNRDLDYTISYSEGRMLFAQPVPSMVTASWHLDHEA
ncbi:hypothetical protein KAI87_15950, partial [Myxococcota bacterium]|nr:hypothetical protein [Myxococcota bacterium]